MNTQDIVQMTNRVANFYRAYSREEAEQGIQTHVQRFWDRRTREAMTAHLAIGGEGLDELALTGIKRALAARH